MAWQIKFDPQSEKDFKGIDQADRRRIFKFLKERVAQLENPRSLGEALSGRQWGRFWKYRVGNYRLICDIQDKAITILVVRVGHRRDIYER